MRIYTKHTLTHTFILCHYTQTVDMVLILNVFPDSYIPRPCLLLSRFHLFPYRITLLNFTTRFESLKILHIFPCLSVDNTNEFCRIKDCARENCLAFVCTAHFLTVTRSKWFETHIYTYIHTLSPKLNIHYLFTLFPLQTLTTADSLTTLDFWCFVFSYSGYFVN